MIPVLHGVWAAAGGLVGDYEHIETQTVGAGGVTTITFSSIPGTYKHLQIRYLLKNTTTGNNIDLQFNGDTATNYSWHQLVGNGSSASSNGGSNSSVIYISGVSNSQPIAAIADILDYANTSKFKTVRALAGLDENGAGYVYFRSGAWRSTSAVTSIKLTLDTGSITQYSSFSLYGVK